MSEIIDFSIFKQKREKKLGQSAEIKTETKILQKDKIDRKNLLKLLAMVPDLISNAKTEKKQFTKLYYDKYFSISGCSDIEIIRKINNFKEQDVHSDPILYSALIDIAIDREIISVQRQSG